MTEVPEHLLQRSRERRAALGGGGDGEGGADAAPAPDSGGAATPATTPAAAPAAASSMPAHPAPPPGPRPEPLSPMAEAHQRRRKIPYWAMPVLAMLPVWAYVYTGTLDPPPAGAGPEVEGEELYGGNGCAGCHGAGGGGGVGPAFTDGAVYETFPNFETHFRWVRLGSQGWLEEVGDTYGAGNQPVNGGMPGFDEGALSDAELLYVILHEREGLGGENPNEQDHERLELAAELFEESPDAPLEEILEEVNAQLGAPEEEGAGPAGDNPEGDAGEGDVNTIAEADSEAETP